MFNFRHWAPRAAAAGLLAAGAALPVHGVAVLTNYSDRHLTLDLGAAETAAGTVSYKIQGMGQDGEHPAIDSLNLFEVLSFKPVVVPPWSKLLITMAAYEQKPVKLGYWIIFKNGLAQETMAFKVFHRAEFNHPEAGPGFTTSTPELFLLDIPLDLKAAVENKGERSQTLGFYRLSQRSETELLFAEAPTRCHSSMRADGPRLFSVRESSWEESPRGWRQKLSSCWSSLSSCCNCD